MTITNNIGIDFEGDLVSVVNDLYYDMKYSGLTIRVTPGDESRGGQVELAGVYPENTFSVILNKADLAGAPIREGNFVIVDGKKYQVERVRYGADGYTMELYLVHPGGS